MPGHGRSDDLTIIRDKTLPYAIRATAGLLYWFSVSAGLIPPTVSVGSAQGRAVPAAIHLAQNYPNPFNPTTTIAFAVPERSRVTLTVYNTLGERVEELVHSEMEAGYHTVLFDASGLAGGVYLYRLNVGDYVQTRKGVLVR